MVGDTTIIANSITRGSEDDMDKFHEHMYTADKLPASACRATVQAERSSIGKDKNVAF